MAIAQLETCRSRADRVPSGGPCTRTSVSHLSAPHHSRPDTPTSTPMDWKKVKTIVVRPDQPAPIVPPMAAVQGHIATADGTGYFVQVASQRSEADAQIAFRSLQAKFPGLLAHYASLIKRADLADKGVRYNVLV